MTTHTKTYTNFMCPRCGQVRQVRTDVICQKRFTGKCQKCHAETSSPPHYYGSDNPAWKRGWFLFDKGYIWISERGNTFAEHRLVMEKHLGRSLKSNELIHHKNGVKTDNRLENLELCTRAEHINIHRDKLLNGRRLKRDGGK